MVIKTKTLLSLLLPLQAIVNDNHMVAILQSVKLDFDTNSIDVTGNNLEVSCSKKALITCDFSSSVCVNYTMLLSAIRSVTDKEIEISLHKGIIDIKHKNGIFKFPFEDSREFPLPKIEKLTSIAEINAVKFKNSIKIANKFVLDNDMEAMGNISIEIGKKVFVRSTDRNRMYQEKVKGKGNESNVLISGKASNSLFLLIGDDKKLKVKYNSSQIYFEFEDTQITILQQQGNFPIAMFKKIIKIPNDALKININVQDLIISLKRVSIVSVKEKYNTVKVQLTKKLMTVSCESEIASSKSKESINIKFKDDRTIGFNYKYLIEIISIFDEEPELFLDSRNVLFIKQDKKIGTLAPILFKK